MTLDRAIAEASRAAAEAIGEIEARRQFTVSKFDRHPDGYLHARVVVNGQRFYFHRRFGSWLAPGHINGHAVCKEPEALLGSVLGREVKFTLSERSSPYDTADRRAKEAAREAAKKATGQEENHDGTRGNDEVLRDDRVRQLEHQEHADDDVRSE
jgi:hypothetical protein